MPAGTRPGNLVPPVLRAENNLQGPGAALTEQGNQDTAADLSENLQEREFKAEGKLASDDP